MKNWIVLFICCFSFSTFLHGQEDVLQKQEEEIKNSAISAGLMMGGGSLVGVDFEVMVAQSRFGVQIGAGITSFGGGINYHLKNSANSPFVSIQYFHQGFGENHYASWIGPMFVYRTKKWFQVGAGIGSRIDKGPQWEKLSEKDQKTTASLLFNLGLFF